MAAALALATGGCTTARETSPPRTATEQLLISTAADHAVEHLTLQIPNDTKVFVDASNFEGIDGKYAVSAIRDRLLDLGAHLSAYRDQSDMVVEIRSGALSVDEKNVLVGVPALEVPLPLAGSFAIPEIALFKMQERRGVAKIAATGYDADDGGLVTSSESQYGFSHQTQWVVLLFLSWTTSDLIPEEKNPPFAIRAPQLPSLPSLSME